MKINFSTNGTLEDHFLRVVQANHEFERQNTWLKFQVDALKDKEARTARILTARVKKLEIQNKKLKHSIHKAYTKHIKPKLAQEFKDNLTHALHSSIRTVNKDMVIDGITLTAGERIWLKLPEEQKTKVSGAGVYQVTLKKSCHFAICDWIKGCHAGYRFTYKGKPLEIETEIFHFNALSKEEALRALNMDEVESFSFIRELTTFEKQKLQNTRSYNS